MQDARRMAESLKRRRRDSSAITQPFEAAQTRLWQRISTMPAGNLELV